MEKRALVSTDQQNRRIGCACRRTSMEPTSKFLEGMGKEMICVESAPASEGTAWVGCERERRFAGRIEVVLG